MKRVWIRVKEDLPHSDRVMAVLKPALEKQGLLVTTTKELPVQMPDLCLCLGGDGTLLSTVRALGAFRYEVPILGIHTSSGLGFLHSLSIPQGPLEPWATDLSMALGTGAFSEEQRWGLTAHVEGSPSEELWALNDVVISKGPLSRMIYLRLRVGDSVLFQRMRGDGLIISSATGSTAYSLSAGGPVVQPTLKPLLIVPICPHEGAQRPVVLDGSSPLCVEMLEHKVQSHLTCDGQVNVDIAAGQNVIVQRAARPLRWVLFRGEAVRSNYYFESLKSKLRYGGE